MITIKEKIKAISSCLGSFKLSASGKNINVICPVCVSKGKSTNKKKLSIDLELGIFHCWVCEAKGPNIGRLCQKYSCNNDASSFLLNLYRKNSETKDQESDEDLKLVPRLPEDFRLIYNQKNNFRFKHHYEYLASRGFNESKMKKFRIGASESYNFKNRVIFPSFDPNLELNYYVSRTIDPKIKLRYKNFEGTRKNIIFNHADIDFSRELILVEGVFDLVNCPDNSTCILGSWLNTDHLLFLEIVRNKTPVVLCLDPDARKKTMKIAKLLTEYCVDVRISNHLLRDFGDMSRSEVDNCIVHAKRYDNADRVGYLIKDIRSGSVF